MPRGVYKRKQKKRAKKYTPRKTIIAQAGIGKQFPKGSHRPSELLAAGPREERRYTIREIVQKLEALDSILR